MCVEWVGEWEVAAKDIVAYKLVEKHEGGYRSPLKVEKRASQSPAGAVGVVLEYVSGQEIASDHPGIYMIAEQYNAEAPNVVLKMTIPKGTMIRRGKVYWNDTTGRSLEVRTINALRVIVGEECDPLMAAQPWYVTTSGSTMAGTFWGYVTASTAMTQTSNTTNANWYYSV